MVSYDYLYLAHLIRHRLKGHQIIGELRQTLHLRNVELVQLKGHQIIGELRHMQALTD